MNLILMSSAGQAFLAIIIGIVLLGGSLAALFGSLKADVEHDCKESLKEDEDDEDGDRLFKHRSGSWG